MPMQGERRWGSIVVADTPTSGREFFRIAAREKWDPPEPRSWVAMPAELDWKRIEAELRRIFRLPPTRPLRKPNETPSEDIIDHIARALRE
jgi:hypothetical protein